jgi:hypothetical protein
MALRDIIKEGLVSLPNRTNLLSGAAEQMVVNLRTENEGFVRTCQRYARG